MWGIQALESHSSHGGWEPLPSPIRPKRMENQKTHNLRSPPRSNKRTNADPEPSPCPAGREPGFCGDSSEGAADVSSSCGESRPEAQGGYSSLVARSPSCAQNRKNTRASKENKLGPWAQALEWRGTRPSWYPARVKTNKKQQI